MIIADLLLHVFAEESQEGAVGGASGPCIEVVHAGWFNAGY